MLCRCCWQGAYSFGCCLRAATLLLRRWRLCLRLLLVLRHDYRSDEQVTV